MGVLSVYLFVRFFAPYEGSFRFSLCAIEAIFYSDRFLRSTTEETEDVTEDPDAPITGAALDQTSAAALESLGEGQGD
jgi:hypothetical protein